MPEKENIVVKKANPLGVRIWISLILFGLIGQLTWMVENMYLSTYIQQNITAASWATSATVIFSAIFAATATILGGAIIDRIGKRKPFICWGYILWGFLTMAFALFGNDVYQGDTAFIAMIVWLFVAVDSIMSFVGSLSNDAAYSAWITDVTDITNRGFVDVILSIFPLIAMIAILVGFSGMANSGKWNLFFAVLGAIPAIVGFLGLFFFKDSPRLKPSPESTYLAQVAYGFRWSNILKNKMIYICFLGSMFGSLAMQLWQPYMISMISDTLGIDYVIPVALVIVIASVLAVLAGKMMDRFGKDKFFYPVALLEVAGGLIAYLTKFFPGQSGPTTVFLILGGTLIMAGSLMMGGLFGASARDYMPEGKAGCFQGIKMILVIMMPMVLASFIAPLIINVVGLTPSAEFIAEHPSYAGLYLYPHELFLWAGLISLGIIFPAYFVKKDNRRIRTAKLAELGKTPEIKI
ncbi:MAG TPA: MFS transporter [Candidatus Izemoplasmatales bacterium]|nr:MFS transporter [Bacillota bacterium]HRY77722.1 MFS transporter [Candidatus Izemoplasmatales bacterium]